MSKIIAKAFDATKKIVRSVFLGSPNLVTSADLNRQLEAIKYQLDQLDDKVGVLSDFSPTYTLNSGTLVFNFDYSYLEFKGCSFSVEKKALSINLTQSAPFVYVCLTANTENVTYDTDFSHEIAGAKFSDGTSYPAANQLVYKNEEIILTHSLVGVNNVIGILAVIELKTNGNIILKNNCLVKSSSLAIGSANTIKDYNSSFVGAVQNGVTYDDAFSSINNRFLNIAPEWDRLLDPETSAPTNIYYKIKNGIFYISLPTQKIYAPKVTLKKVYILRKLGAFPSEVKQALMSYFSGINFPELPYYIDTDLNKGVVPFLRVSSGSAYVPSSGSGATSPTRSLYGTGFLSLVCTYDLANENVLDDILLGAIVWDMVKITDSEFVHFDGPTSWGDLSNSDNNVQGYLTVPEQYIMLPLFR